MPGKRGAYRKHPQGAKREKIQDGEQSELESQLWAAVVGEIAQFSRESEDISPEPDSGPGCRNVGGSYYVHVDDLLKMLSRVHSDRR